MAYIAVVTGASGFVAGELVKQLLEKGYTVRATLRNPDDSSKTSHLTALAAALPGKLQLAKADLLTQGSFDANVEGADYVFHTASPFKIDVSDPQRDLIDPAVEGTRNVMGAVARHKQSVKRVVLTSSVAAVHGNQGKAAPKGGALYTEADFNTTSSIENGEAYWLSKTLAEQAAWEIAKREGIDLVTILPNFVLGPMLGSRDDGLSVGFMQGWLQGKGSSGSLVITDVRDVGRAHVLAAETPSASGRYIVSQRCSMSPAFVSRTLQARFPTFVIPDGEDVAAEERIDNSKAERELGLRVTPMACTLVDMATAALQLGLATPTPAA